MIFSKIKTFFKDNKKIFYYFGFFIVVYMMSSEVGFAVEPDTESTLSDEVITGINGFFQIIGGILGVLTQLVGVLLTPDWVNGTVIGISEHIKDLWILMSNIVYFIFAMLLIVIAFMNIVGKGEKWELKQAMPKFIIGVLIVPFSWFFIQFSISMSSVLSASVLALPFETIGTEQSGFLEQIPICTDMTIRKFEEGGEPSKCNQEKADRPMLSDVLKGKGMYGLINVYTYSIFRIDEFETLKKSNVSGGVIKTLLNLSIKKIAEILFIIIYLILLISLALVLFTRVIWLWLYMIFAPVFGLLFFFGKEKEGIMDGKFSVTQFISLAMIPVYVSAALSFGFLFIMVAGNNLGGENATNNLVRITSYEEGGITMSKISIFDVEIHGGTGDASGRFNFSMEGDFTNDSGDSMSFSSIITTFQGAIGTIVMQLLGLAVLWISVIAALKGSKVTEAVVEPIAAFGKSVGDLAMKSPQYAPVFGGLSAQGLKRVGTMPSQAMESKVSKNVEPWQTGINKAFGTETISHTEMTEVKNMMKDGLNKTELTKVQAKYRAWVEKYGRNNSTVQEMEKEILRSMETDDLTKSSLNAQQLGINVNSIKSDEENLLVNYHALGGYRTSESTRANVLMNSRTAGSYQDEKREEKQVTGDMTQGTLSNEDFNKADGTTINNRYKINYTGQEQNGVGVGEVLSKLDSGNGAERYTINIQSLNKDGSNFDSIRSDDKKELLKLFDLVGKDKGNFIEILEGLNYTVEGSRIIASNIETAYKK